MDYYLTFLSRVSALPPGTTFTAGQAYQEGWAAIPAKEKIKMCRRFKTEVDTGQIPDVSFLGTIPGSTHPHKQYKKI